MPRTPGAGRGSSNPEWTPRRPDEGGSGRRTGPLVGMAVVGVIVLLTLSCAVILNATGGLTALSKAFAGPTPVPTQVRVSVPNFKNKTLADAQALAQTFNLSVTVTNTIQSATVPKGSVIDQNPEAGNYVGVASVSLTLSGGPNQLALLDVTKKQVFDACYAITHAPYYLTCANQGAEPSNLPAGEVTRTDPAAGTLVTPGTSTVFGQTIMVWTSEGPPPTATPDPSPSPTPTKTPCPTVTPTPTPGPGC
jgi:beta-lactam-binding protein with PASTA domain